MKECLPHFPVQVPVRQSALSQRLSVPTAGSGQGEEGRLGGMPDEGKRALHSKEAAAPLLQPPWVLGFLLAAAEERLPSPPLPPTPARFKNRASLPHTC